MFLQTANITFYLRCWLESIAYFSSRRVFNFWRSLIFLQIITKLLRTQSVEKLCNSDAMANKLNCVLSENVCDKAGFKAINQFQAKEGWPCY